MVRELCATTLRVAAPGLLHEYLREVGWPWWRSPVNLVLKTVASDPNPRSDGNLMVGELLVRALSVCLGPPCKVRINRLSTSHRYLRLLIRLAMISLYDGTLWRLLLWLIVCTTLIAIVAYLVWLLILEHELKCESKDSPLRSFLANKPTSQKPCMIRGKVFPLDGLVLLSISILSIAL
jgi:phage shock protein PspC (stress-responsive transcriptional regulator)